MDLMRSVPVCPLKCFPQIWTLSIGTAAGLPTIGVRDPSGLDSPSILVHIPHPSL